MNSRDIEEDKKYIFKKRQNLLDRLNKSIELGNIDDMETTWKNFIRMHKNFVMFNDSVK